MITLITNEFPPETGGVATYSLDIARALQSEGHQIEVVAARINGRALEYDKKQGIKIYRTKEYTHAPLRHIARLRMLANLLSKTRTSMIWASDWRTGMTASLIAQRHQIPLVISAYGSEISISSSNPLKKIVALKTYSAAKRILAISRYTRSLLLDLGIPHDKIEVITPCVDPDVWEPNKDIVDTIRKRHQMDGKKVVLSLARLTPRKGHDMVIRALPFVLEEIPNVIYVIAGEGDDKDRLHNLACKLGLDDQVVFAGYVPEDEKSAYYHSSDVYLLLSRKEGNLVEGFGITILEAGACGKPVVVGDHGGTRDAVKDGITGIIVPPDNINSIAQAMIKLLSDLDLAARFGSNAIDHIRNEASCEIFARKVGNIFHELA